MTAARDDRRIYEINLLTSSQADVLGDLMGERDRQDAKFGEQNHPDGTAAAWDEKIAVSAREACDKAFAEGRGTWRHILFEEVAEAFAESDRDKLRAELLQVAGVAVAWVEALDRRAEHEAEARSRT